MMAKKPKDRLSRQALMLGGALLAHITPKLGQDQKVDVRPLIRGVTYKNFKTRKSDIIKRVDKLCDGKLASDASLEGIAELLDVLEAHPDAIDDADPVAQPEVESTDAEPPEFLKKKEGDDEGGPLPFKGKPETGAADDEEEEEEEEKKKKKPPVGDDEDPEHHEVEKGKAVDDKHGDDDKRGMDAAIRAGVAAVRRDMRNVAQAIRSVRSRTGDLMAFDSAERPADIFRAAFKHQGMTADIKNLPDEALEPLWNAVMANRGSGKRDQIATDAASKKSFNERFPEAARLAPNAR